MTQLLCIFTLISIIILELIVLQELEVEILEKFDVQFHELVDKCAQALEEPSSISKKHTKYMILHIQFTFCSCRI